MMAVVTLLTACQQKEAPAPMQVVVSSHVDIVGNRANIVRLDTASLVIVRDTVANEKTDTIYNLRTSLTLILDSTFMADKMEDSMQLQINGIIFVPKDSVYADNLIAFLKSDVGSKTNVEFTGKAERSKFLKLTNALNVSLTGFSFHELPFTFLAPNFQKIVKVTASNVNICEQPNANSKMVDQANKNEILAVVDETEDWYKICNSHWIAPYADEGGNATKQITIVGYIMKKYCENVVLQPVKKDTYGFYVKPSGRHKGTCLWYSYSGHEEDWYGLSFGIGKQVNNLFILPYRISVDEYGDTSKRVEFKKNSDGYKMIFKEGIIEGCDINLEKLTDIDIDYIVENVAKMSMKSGRVIFFLDSNTPNEMPGYWDINYGEGLNQLPLIRY